MRTRSGLVRVSSVLTLLGALTALVLHACSSFEASEALDAGRTDVVQLDASEASPPEDAASEPADAGADADGGPTAFCDSRSSLLFCDDFDPRDGEAPLGKWSIWGVAEVEKTTWVSPPNSMRSSNLLADSGVINGIVRRDDFEVVEGQVLSIGFDIHQLSPPDDLGFLAYVEIYDPSNASLRRSGIAIRYDMSSLVVELLPDSMLSAVARQIVHSAPPLPTGQWRRVELDIRLSKTATDIKFAYTGRAPQTLPSQPTLPASGARMRFDLGVAGLGGGPGVALFDNVTLELK